jgi:hypothetical protein
VSKNGRSIGSSGKGITVDLTVRIAIVSDSLRHTPMRRRFDFAGVRELAHFTIAQPRRLLLAFLAERR